MQRYTVYFIWKCYSYLRSR